MGRLLLSLVLLAMSGLAQAATVLVLGDSISAGFGLTKVEDGWVGLLQDKLKPKGYSTVNASITGETTSGGLTRIDELLSRHKPAVVILELGGNDGLRGLPPKQMEANLGTMIARAKSAGARVLLVGMRIPPNYGKRYADSFREVYPELAKREGVALVPFLLEGVGGHEQMMQADGIHPNQDAQALLVAQVWDKLQPLLKK